MSGHYGNRKGGCGGRVGGNGRGQVMSTPSTSHTNNIVEDYLFYVGSIKQALNYEITAEFVVNHIKKTFDQRKDVSGFFFNSGKIRHRRLEANAQYQFRHRCYHQINRIQAVFNGVQSITG